MRNYQLTTNWVMATVLLFFPLSLLAAMVDTSTIVSANTSTITIESLLQQGQGVYDAFKIVGVLAGIAAAVNLLVNLTKFGPVNTFIVRKKAKWVRPILALLCGFLSGLVSAVTKGLSLPAALLYAVGGLFAGGGAIALHELWLIIRGEV